MSIYCFFHGADDDGKSSAAIVKAKYSDATLIGINYGEPFPWEKIEPKDTVFVVDFCVEPIEEMIELSKKSDLVWIDHHKSSLEQAASVGFNPDGLRMIGRSGCELTWEFLFHGKQMPLAIHLIGRYDVWDHTDPRVLPFMYGMRLEDTRPSNDGLWDNLLSEDTDVLEKILARGNIAFPYQVKEDERYAKSSSFEAEFEGYRAICLNVSPSNSLMFDSVWDEENHDVMLAFVFRGDKVKASVYTTRADIDCSKIALKLGGGGHKEAAGFEVKDAAEFFNKLKKK